MGKALYKTGLIVYGLIFLLQHLTINFGKQIMSEHDMFTEIVTRIFSENISCLFMTIESKQDSQSNPASVRWWCSRRFQEMLSQLSIVGSLNTLSRGDSSTPPTMALQHTRPPHLVVPREVIAHVENQMNSFHDTRAFLYK